VCPRIFTYQLQKTTKVRGKESQFPEIRIEPIPTEYKALLSLRAAQRLAIRWHKCLWTVPLQEHAWCCIEVRRRIIMHRHPSHLLLDVTYASPSSALLLYTTSHFHPLKRTGWQTVKGKVTRILTDTHLAILFIRALKWQPRDNTCYRHALLGGWHKWSRARRKLNNAEALYELSWDILASRLHMAGTEYI
jgi:hypothetical protein